MFTPLVTPPRVQAYLDALVQACAESGHGLVSVILFGSSVTGGFAATASDVDLVLVTPDGVGATERRRLRETAERIEALHGFRESRPHPPSSLESLVEKITANVRTFFICTKSDLLSGDVARILELRPSQAIFVDRAVVPSIVASAVTVWGEDLLAQVPLLPLRRLDVFKAFHGLFGQAVLCLAVFPLLPGATKYAMGTLKRSLHNCFFCYHCRRASLEEEVAFFQQRLGASRTLTQLLELRGAYRRSFAFVVRCLPTLIWLHWRTALDNRFPREVLKAAVRQTGS